MVTVARHCLEENLWPNGNNEHPHYVFHQVALVYLTNEQGAILSSGMCIACGHTADRLTEDSSLCSSKREAKE